jgi:hypothetical protein
MAVDQAQQWLPDPAGKHQYRLHSDGKPTEWVSDDGSMTIDHLESPPSAEGPAPAVASVQPGSTSWGSASNSQPAAPTPSVRPAGWYRNASNPSEVRYWDGSQWAVDQTVATAGPSPSPAPLSPTAPTALSESPASELAPGPDAPGRHSLGRSRSTEFDGLSTEAPTTSSVWAQPDVYGDRTPAPAPAPAAAPAPPAASVAPAPAPAPAVAPAPVVTPPAVGGAPDPIASTPPAPRAVTGADWYPDPADRARLRYWDGAGWTDQVIDQGPSRH